LKALPMLGLRRSDTNPRHSHYQTGVIGAVNVRYGQQLSREFAICLALSLQFRFLVIPMAGMV
jgi:hypothetical protein